MTQIEHDDKCAIQVTAKDVADVFKVFAHGYKQDINPYKLIKLVYISFTWFYAYSGGRKLFEDKILVATNGPVIKSLQDEYSNETNPDCFASDMWRLENNYPSEQDETKINARLLEIQTKFIKMVPQEMEMLPAMIVAGVWERYGGGKDFKSITHDERSPWHYCRTHGMEEFDFTNQEMVNALQARAFEGSKPLVSYDAKLREKLLNMVPNAVKPTIVEMGQLAS
ncbi:MAG: DUF4065 domain-containing protein [Methylacidiphilales bacterium]|nr:DUF4065 domain-containing protein [Candidatus Methylacidiphilales bacterium]